MTTEFADISSFQPDTLDYMRKLHNHATGLFVKLTEGSENGSHYLNPKAGMQLLNGFEFFKSIGVYHYFRGNSQRYGMNDPVNEAKWFVKNIIKLGLNRDTVCAIDVEDQSLQYNVTADINLFLDYVYQQGFHYLVVYASASWFNSQRIKRTQLKYQPAIWVASYGVNQPGVDNAQAWQYTNNGYQLKTDFNYDFAGILQ
ncbi:GH25 family lysozyme [Secundilactobacillus mixtipabuli]|uniref:Holin n=1 Tax=Secundilactobacillus mixtipabuli TaxID=1435342 RepID=A0A1Z5IA76_9LACO|nr:GH25 family lysozyme [Secundilactobacillus mixtipabuli]GAW98682.1 holin [Secundilactobacillus mixtipabuli]